MKSISRVEFENKADYFDGQIKFASNEKNGLTYDIQQCVYRNAVFQTSAALEEYLKSVLEDWIHSLHSNNKLISDAPRELILWAAGKKQRAAFQEYIVRGDEGKFIQDLSDLNDLNDFFVDSVLVKQVIHQTAHVRDRKYPSKKNIIALFKRFGIKDLFKAIEKEGKKDYKNILASFSDIRTEIAHQHPSPDLIFSDLQQSLDSISDLVAKTDQVLYAHVLMVSGEDCWKTTRLL